MTTKPPFWPGPFGHATCTAVNDALLHGLPHGDPPAEGDRLTHFHAGPRVGVDELGGP